MANNKNLDVSDGPPVALLARRFQESMATVLRLAEIFGAAEAIVKSDSRRSLASTGFSTRAKSPIAAAQRKRGIRCAERVDSMRHRLNDLGKLLLPFNYCIRSEKVPIGAVNAIDSTPCSEELARR